MKLKFFCDENITKKIRNAIEANSFEIDSIRSLKLFGIANGEIIKFINEKSFTLITFDKDFIDPNINLINGTTIIDIHPNRDEFSVSLVEEFLIFLKENKIDSIKEFLSLVTNLNSEVFFTHMIFFPFCTPLSLQIFPLYIYHLLVLFHSLILGLLISQMFLIFDLIYL